MIQISSDNLLKNIILANIHRPTEDLNEYYNKFTEELYTLSLILK